VNCKVNLIFRKQKYKILKTRILEILKKQAFYVKNIEKRNTIKKIIYLCINNFVEQL